MEVTLIVTEMSKVMESTKTNRNQKKLCSNSYLYVFDKTSKDGAKIFWGCKKKADKYSSRLHTIANDEYLSDVGNHNYDSDYYITWSIIIK